MISLEYDECVEIMAYAVSLQNVEDINHLLLLQTPSASPLSMQDIVEDIQNGSYFLVAVHNGRIVGLVVVFHQEETHTGEKGLSGAVMVHQDYRNTDIASELRTMGESRSRKLASGFPRDPYASRGWKKDGSGIFRKTF